MPNSFYRFCRFVLFSSLLGRKFYIKRLQPVYLRDILQASIQSCIRPFSTSPFNCPHPRIYLQLSSRLPPTILSYSSIHPSINRSTHPPNPSIHSTKHPPYPPVLLSTQLSNGVHKTLQFVLIKLFKYLFMDFIHFITTKEPLLTVPDP